MVMISPKEPYRDLGLCVGRSYRRIKHRHDIGIGAHVRRRVEREFYGFLVTITAKGHIGSRANFAFVDIQFAEPCSGNGERGLLWPTFRDVGFPKADAREAVGLWREDPWCAGCCLAQEEK